MIDRTKQPIVKELNRIDFLAPIKKEISLFVPLYHMKNVPNETARIELYFNAGKCRGTKGTPSFVNGLLLSGTDKLTSIEINNRINKLGGFYESSISMENAVVTIYCLREFVLEITKTVIDAIQNVAFLPAEVNELIADRKQQFAINMEKVSYQTQRMFQREMFSSHPNYNSLLSLKDFEKIAIDELKEFHKKHYQKGLQKVVLVGDIEDSIVEDIIDLCSPLSIENSPAFAKSIQHNAGRFDEEKEGAIQSAIRVGRFLFNKQHEDYLDFLVLHTILGDYFGSRLMSNIREDKGYTYGIGSMISELNNTGFFLVATEVRKDVKQDTINEIKKEFERLIQSPVPEDELMLVKNYMLGQLLKSADGPYAMMDLFLSAEMQGKSLDLYNQAIHAIHAITPARIQELASKYLVWDEMTVVSYG